MEKRILGAGRFLRLISQDGWEFVERSGICGIVAIVPLTDKGELVFVEQFRQPVAASVIELPAGLVGDVPGNENEPLLQAAQRELLEETGYQARHWRHLLDGPPSPGVCSEVVSWFLATGLSKVGSGGGDHSERIETHTVAVGNALAWLGSQQETGLMVDPKVFLGLYFAERELGS